ncbi:MAG: hypothetical protein NTW83_09750, partial [Cyanobacteria bacterium]|nr:hypothetical protein [Cyanobacteriota bacterium]
AATGRPEAATAALTMSAMDFMNRGPVMDPLKRDVDLIGRPAGALQVHELQLQQGGCGSSGVITSAGLELNLLRDGEVQCLLSLTSLASLLLFKLGSISVNGDHSERSTLTLLPAVGHPLMSGGRNQAAPVGLAGPSRASTDEDPPEAPR